MIGGNGDGRRAGRRRWLPRVAAGAAALGLAAVAGRLLAPGPTGGRASERSAPALHRWDLVGCWDLRVGEWRVRWRSDSAAGDGAARASPRPGADAGARPDAPGAPDGRAPTPAGGRLPASFDPPSRLVLLPDSVDRWGRVLPSRRAEPLGGDDHPRRSLRWLVRGDTLWLVWSEADTRAGVALRRAGDSLAGRIRTVRGGDSLDATAPASARRINCWTLAPDPPPGSGPLERR